MTPLILAVTLLSSSVADGRPTPREAAIVHVHRGLTGTGGHRRSTLPQSRTTAKRVGFIAAPAGANSEPPAALPWRDGIAELVVTAPERVTDIALQPGENLISVAAGDTARWIIGDTVSGAGPARRSHLLVKPTLPGLRTNLVVATDRRVYHLELDSRAGSATTSVAWIYPEDELLALRRSAALATTVAATSVSPEVAVERLNFNYRIGGDHPAWRPLRIFDDGQQVFIEFTAELGTSEAPPLFVIGPQGKAELVNYRLRGRYYVVDRLFGRAELRLGGKRQQVVSIVRGGAR